MKTKVCNDCNIEKTLECFHKTPRGIHGVHAKCKECKKIYDAHHYKTSGRKKKEKIERARRSSIINTLKRIKGCYNCDENEPCCLDFHHLKNKKFNVSASFTRDWKKVKDEIRKCVVICSNCHRKLHAGLITI